MTMRREKGTRELNACVRHGSSVQSGHGSTPARCQQWFRLRCPDRAVVRASLLDKPGDYLTMEKVLRQARDWLPVWKRQPSLALQ
jgi:hypothetical protein